MSAEITTSTWKAVEVGRVGIFAKGPYEGRLAAIVQIIDHKRVLVEGPSSDAKQAVVRHAAPLSAISLSSIVIPKLPFGAGSSALKKKWEAAEVESQWHKSSYAKSQAKFARRKQLTDFERFKVMTLRKQARFAVRKATAKKA